MVSRRRHERPCLHAAVPPVLDIKPTSNRRHQTALPCNSVRMASDYGTNSIQAVSVEAQGVRRSCCGIHHKPDWLRPLSSLPGLHCGHPATADLLVVQIQRDVRSVEGGFPLLNPKHGIDCRLKWNFQRHLKASLFHVSYNYEHFKWWLCNAFLFLL